MLLSIHNSKLITSIASCIQRELFQSNGEIRLDSCKLKPKLRLCKAIIRKQQITITLWQIIKKLIKKTITVWAFWIIRGTMNQTSILFIKSIYNKKNQNLVCLIQFITFMIINKCIEPSVLTYLDLISSTCKEF